MRSMLHFVGVGIAAILCGSMGCHSSRQKPIAISPWVSFFEIGARQDTDPNLQPEFRLPADGPYLAYEATFISAPTVLRAHVANALATDKYRKQENEIKSATDRQALQQSGSNAVIVRVRYFGSRGMVGASRDFWKARSQAELKRLIALVAGGNRIRPVEVLVESDAGLSGAFQVVFDRKTEGGPIITPSMSEVYLEIDDPNVKVKLPFDVKKMMVRGELVY